MYDKSFGKVYFSIIIGFIVAIGVMLYIYSKNEYSSRLNEIEKILLKQSDRIRVYCNEYDRKAYGVANVGSIFWELEKNKATHDSYTDTVIMNYLRISTSYFSEAGGIGIWYEPYSFVKNKKYYGPYAYWKDKKVETTWFYNSEEYDYFSWDWYTTCLPKDWDRTKRRSQRAYWSKPYLDPEYLKEYLVTVGAPIYNYDSVIVGITSVDIYIKKLYRYFDSLKVTPDSYAFVINPQTGSFLSFPYDSSFNLKPVSSVKWIWELYQKIPNNNENATHSLFEREGYNVYFYQAHPYLILGIMVSKSDLMKPIYKSIFNACLFSVVLILIVLYLVKISLKKITELASRNRKLYDYLKQIMDTVPDAIAVYDEFGKLIETNWVFREFFENSTKLLDNLILPKDLTIYNSPGEFVHTLSFNKEYSFNSLCNKTDGNSYHALIRICKFMIEGKLHVLVIFTDISELINKQNEINTLNKELENRVIERTALLNAAMEELKIEIAEKEQARGELAQSNEELNLLNQTIALDAQRLSLLNEELAKSEKALKEANITKDKFFGIIAHDLKNPLHAIQISGELLADSMITHLSPKELEIAKIINKSTKYLNDLLDNLLIWSRSQSGRIEYSPQPLQIKDLFDRIKLILSEQASAKNIELIIDSDYDHVVEADVNMIDTVLRNLVSNAIKFTNKNGTVKIKSQIIDNDIKISIEDTGIGIPPENVNKLFRLDSSITTPGTAKEQGTGLGLTLCSEFIQKHGKNIQVQSELGAGSTFSFTLKQYSGLNDLNI